MPTTNQFTSFNRSSSQPKPGKVAKSLLWTSDKWTNTFFNKLGKNSKAPLTQDKLAVDDKHFLSVLLQTSLFTF